MSKRFTIPVPVGIYVFTRVILLAATIGTVFAAFLLPHFDVVNLMLLAMAVYMFYDLTKDGINIFAYVKERQDGSTRS